MNATVDLDVDDRRLRDEALPRSSGFRRSTRRGASQDVGDRAVVREIGNNASRSTFRVASRFTFTSRSTAFD
jgi:hypothetical protein